MFDLARRVSQHPINDPAYLRHLRSADVFNELTEARDAEAATMAAVTAAMIEHAEAAIAKAKLFESMEDL